VPAVIDAMLKLEVVQVLETASELQHYVEKGKQVSVEKACLEFVRNTEACDLYFQSTSTKLVVDSLGRIDKGWWLV
jgi:hypothetical protein